jgi:hypothetical protein
MNDETANGNRGQMIDTTDCLEAVSVFRGWKNLFFLIALICLLIVEISFWLVDTGAIAVPQEQMNQTGEAGLVSPMSLAAQGQAPTALGRSPTATDANSTSATAGSPRTISNSGKLAWLTFDRFTRILDLVNGILVISAVLFCLSMFFSLTVSLIGRLGGINHISRAFFLSLITAILMIPWQNIPGVNAPGIIFSPQELRNWMATKAGPSLNTAIYYVRFVGYWVVVLLLLLSAQLRSARWTKAILRRLEII